MFGGWWGYVQKHVTGGKRTIRDVGKEWRGLDPEKQKQHKAPKTMKKEQNGHPAYSEESQFGPRPGGGGPQGAAAP